MTQPTKLSLLSPTENFTFEGEESSIKIGRSQSCEFSVPKEDLSREHCLLEKTKSGYFITDLGSRNGVVVDRKRISPHTKTKITLDTHVLLANIYTLKINPPGFVSQKKLEQNSDIESYTTTFEFASEEKTSGFSYIKSLLKSHEGKNERSELLKMVFGYIVILGFVLYQVLGR